MKKEEYFCDICGKPMMSYQHNEGEIDVCSDKCKKVVSERSKKIVFGSNYAGQIDVEDGNGESVGSIFCGCTDEYTWRQENRLRLTASQLEEILKRIKKENKRRY